MSGYPKVTIITPTTRDRAAYNALCNQYALYQDYAGEIEHLWDYDEGSIGEKLNRLCERAAGEIIIRFDSDDFYSPQWVRLSVEALTATGSEITGLSSAYLYNPYGSCLKYTYQGRRSYAIGASMCFTKEAWSKDKFKHTSNGEDFYFQFYKKCAPHANDNHFCAIIHSANTTSHRKYHGKSYSLQQIKIPQMIMGDCFGNYPVMP